MQSAEGGTLRRNRNQALREAVIYRIIASPPRLGERTARSPWVRSVGILSNRGGRLLQVGEAFAVTRA